VKVVERLDNLDVMLQKKDKDGYIEHLICEGSRRHVIYYDSQGRHCIEKNCEINKKYNNKKENEMDLRQFALHQASLRKRQISSGIINVDETRDKVCKNCFHAKRLIVGCGGDAGMICELKTEYRGEEPIYQSVDANDTCENFQY